MSGSDRALASPTSPAEQSQGDRDRALGFFQVGDRLPVSLSKQQLAGVLGVSVGRLDVLRKERSHPAIKRLAGPGHPRFSGAVAQAWLDQQPAADEQPARRFFASHGQHRASSVRRSSFKSLESGS